MLRYCLAYILAGLLLAAGPLQPLCAQDLPGLRPTFETDFYVWNRVAAYGWRDQPVNEQVAEWMEAGGSATWRITPGVRLHGSGEVRVRAYGSDTSDWHTRVYLNETYLNVGWRQFTIRAGHQIVRWGKIDAVSPLDNVSPENLVGGSVRPLQERKEPVPMLNLKYIEDLSSFQILWIPTFRPSLIDYYGHNWALLDTCNRQCPSIVEEEIPFTLGNGELGARWQNSVRGIDIALSMLWNRRDRPTLVPPTLPPNASVDPPGLSLLDFRRLAGATDQPLRLEYNRQQIYGIEVEGASGRFGYRADAALIRDQPMYTDQLTMRRHPTVEIAVGVDAQNLGDWYLNVQASETLIPDYEPDLLFQNRWTHAVSGEISRTWFDDDLSFAMSGWYQFDPHSLVLNPSISLERWGAVELEAGAHVLDRGAQTLIQHFEANDEIYFTAEYRF